jgi:hypothetical protein
MKAYVKDPDATLDYSFDWGPWLMNDIIQSSTWIVDSGITIVPSSESFDDTVTTVFLSGGAEGMKYNVTNRIVTQGSRTDERSILIRVRDR